MPCVCQMRLCTDQPKGKDGERVVMKLIGPAVDALVEVAPETHSKHVVCEGKTKALHLWVLKAIHGLLQSAMLCYKKFKQDIESIGFEVNHYDPCVACQHKGESRKSKGSK